MYEAINYKTLLEQSKFADACLVDVRTKEEFEEAHIPGAISMELFNHQERAAMGTLYKQKRVAEAKRYGIEVASKKLIGFTMGLEALLEKHSKVVFYCARGGYRSSAIVGLFKGIGYPVFKLDGGYKAYRHYVNDALVDAISDRTYVTLFGHTGTGKTKLLAALEERGYPVIDLEGLSHHRGSILGGVGLDDQPSQKQFESELLRVYENLPEGAVFLEGESRKIGSIFVPDVLMQAMEDGIKVSVVSSLDKRVERIYQDYVHQDDEKLVSLLEKFRRYLSNDVVDEFKEKIRAEEYDHVIRHLMTDYYDKKYASDKRSYDFILENELEERAVDELLEKIAAISSS